MSVSTNSDRGRIYSRRHLTFEFGLASPCSSLLALHSYMHHILVQESRQDSRQILAARNFAPTKNCGKIFGRREVCFCQKWHTIGALVIRLRECGSYRSSRTFLQSPESFWADFGHNCSLFYL